MNTQTQHTPGLWECGTTDSPIIINSPDNRVIALVYDVMCSPHDEKTAAAKAKFIVTACNAHDRMKREIDLLESEKDKLVAALQAIETVLASVPDVDRGNSVIRYAWHKARAALAEMSA